MPTDPTRKIIAMLCCMLCCAVASAEKIKVDGIVRITANGKQWSGVAIRDDQVLTVWHPEEYGEVCVEFPQTSHGSKVRIQLPGRVVKANRRADLALIAVDGGDVLQVRTYNVARRKARKVVVRGYAFQRALQVVDAPLMSEGNLSDGFPLDRYQFRAVSGMSGSPAIDGGHVVGIQTAGSDTTFFVPTVVIEGFLSGEIGDER